MTTGSMSQEERAQQLKDSELVKLPRCKRCNLSYVQLKSTSALKLTYCSFLCELGDLGFSMAGLETMKRPEETEGEQEAPEAELETSSVG
jgi:hypothetical protein